MGEVYLAEEVELGRTVALKLLARNLADDRRFRERFLRESRLAASLNHPNIVPVYRAGEANGVLFIAMHFVEGTDLWQLLRENEGGLEAARAVSIVEQVADALDAAHAHKLVHRDVKPANVLIAKGRLGDHCYLADFGLTRHASSQSRLTGTGEFLGTVDYVAPEQIRAEAHIDHRVDVYSLGCVLFESLAGKPPYRGDSDYSVLWSHVHDPPPTLSDQRNGLPAALDSVIEHALAKSPDDRYPTAGVLAESARAALDDNRVPRAPAARPRAPAPQTQPARSIHGGGRDASVHADVNRLRGRVAASRAITPVVLLVALLLLVAAGFGARALWNSLHPAAATGTIRFQRTEDESGITRAGFYQRYFHHDPPSKGRSGQGLIVLVKTGAHHAGTCGLQWTAMNVNETQPVSNAEFIDQTAQDVTGGSACDGEKHVWLPLPCLPSDTQFRYELDLYAGAKQLDSTETGSYLSGGSC